MLLLALLAAPMVPAQAVAIPSEDPCRIVLRSLEAARHERMPQEIGYSGIQLTALPSFCVGWTVFDIARRRRGDHSDWVIRRQISDDLHHTRTVSWLSSERCPRVLAVLAKLDQMSFTVGMNALTKHPPLLTAMMDGTDYTFTNDGARQGDGPNVRISVSGNQGPIADWAEHDLASLADCWRPVLD